ncbi:hypothetical protein ON010_g7650 [Phytophthora cinnamomi]|nr:hypothetical protein ON010_g7650 [Phytophthora cinnamomi]
MHLLLSVTEPAEVASAASLATTGSLLERSSPAYKTPTLAAREEAHVGHSRLQELQRFIRLRAGRGRELVDLVALQLPLVPPEQQKQPQQQSTPMSTTPPDVTRRKVSATDRSRCAEPPAGVSVTRLVAVAAASSSSVFGSLASALTLAAARRSNSADLTLSRSRPDRNVCSASKRVSTATCHMVSLAAAATDRMAGQISASCITGRLDGGSSHSLELLVERHELGQEGLEVEDVLGAALHAVLVVRGPLHELVLEVVVQAAHELAAQHLEDHLGRDAVGDQQRITPDQQRPTQQQQQQKKEKTYPAGDCSCSTTLARLQMYSSHAGNWICWSGENG